MQANRATAQWRPGQSLDQFLRHPFVRISLEQLLQARYAADTLKLDVWAMAVELASLLAAGCTTTQLRLLMAAGYIEHAEEVSQPADRARSFRLGYSMKFGPDSCFALTETGVTFLAESPCEQRNGHAISRRNGEMPSTPNWDPEVRELSVGAEVVKQFQRPAPLLELVLSAFQEMKWPSHLDDPLPPKQGIVPNERLRDTVRRLNRCQKPRLVHFSSNGLGSGIRWTWLNETPQKTHG